MRRLIVLAAATACALLCMASSAFAVSFSIQDKSVDEGSSLQDGPTVRMPFQITDRDGYENCFIYYHTNDGTATSADQDYAETSGGHDEGVGIVFTVLGDTKYEPDETLTVTVTSVFCGHDGGPQNIPIGRATATLTILNDDPKPLTASVSDPSVVEGNLGSTSQLVFGVTVQNADAYDCTFDYTTADGTANQPVDYVKATGSGRSGAGFDGKVPITVIGDNVAEAAETVKLEVSNVQCEPTIAAGVVTVTDGDFEGVGTITDDDTVTTPPPTGCDVPGAIRGTAGNDVLRGSDGDDVICGFGGNDKLYGFGGDDVIYGGTGADQIYGGDGENTLYGEDGADRIFGGPFDDVIDGGSAADVLSGGSGNDKMTGGVGNDTMTGDKGSDTMAGGDGDDKMQGGDGDDSLKGEIGKDSLNGGAGFDALDGGEGNDALNGGTQVDSCVQGAGTGARVSCES